MQRQQSGTGVPVGVVSLVCSTAPARRCRDIFCAPKIIADEAKEVRSETLDVYSAVLLDVARDIWN